MTTQTLPQRAAPRPLASGGGDNTPVIEIDGLVKTYGDRRVLSGATFSIGSREIFGILGPNGVGKTTAVEIIQGLRPRDAGRVTVLGHDPARERNHLRGLLGAQLQSSALPERLRVGEALRLFARLAGDVVDWRELRDEWDLARLERSAFGSLSGGERQRLFVALALVNRPRIVFLDELTQGLDPVARRETWRLISKIREQGTTVVLVSHYMDEVEELCDRVAVLHGGRITECDTPRNIVARLGGAVRTRFSLPPRDWLPALTALPGVHTAVRDGVAVEVVGDAATPVLVAAELVAHGVAPTDFAVTRPSLEDVFLLLTEGGRS